MFTKVYTTPIALLVTLLLTACGGKNNDTTQDNKMTDNSTTGCEAGAQGCACLDDGGCAAGLTCNASSVCEAVETKAMGFRLSNDAARACEMLLTDTQDARIIEATFGEDAHGALRRRDSRVALAFASKTDTSFGADSLALQIEGDTEAFKIESLNCFDAQGNALDDVTAAFE